MASIYDIDFGIQAKIYTRPKFRNIKFLAFLSNLLYPLTWLMKYQWKGYKEGLEILPRWNDTLEYPRYQMVIWDDGAVYMRYSVVDKIKIASYIPEEGYVAGVVPSDTKYWQKIADSFVGFDERIKYNSTILSLEYMLNKHFGYAWPANYPVALVYDNPLIRPTIYITPQNYDTNVFLVGEVDYTDSSVIGIDIWANMDFVGEGDILAETAAFVVNFPLSEFNSVSDPMSSVSNKQYSDPSFSKSSKFEILQGLVSKRKHYAYKNSYTSY